MSARRAKAGDGAHGPLLAAARVCSEDRDVFEMSHFWLAGLAGRGPRDFDGIATHGARATLGPQAGEVRIGGAAQHAALP